MNGTQRLLAVAVGCAILLGGFAFGRMTESPRTNAEENKATVNQLQPAQPQQPETAAAAENQTFYLTDYKTGYNDGFNAGTGSQTAATIQTDRTGYNDGYKEGYADAIQTKAAPQPTRMAAARVAQPGVEYRATTAQPRRGPSKLKTALTIAAPAAIGAGIGAAAGGGKGAAAGALIGGGGGALYHVIKNKN
ncbi:MAG: hypothetical protein SF339_14565 [Blastocatellia bacterium]|nr:hypothetical protein [Blastocatellia bacterium]